MQTETFRRNRIYLVGHCRQVDHLVKQRDEDQLRLINECKHEQAVATTVHCQDTSSQELCLDCGLHVRFQSVFPNPTKLPLDEFKKVQENLDIPVVTLTTAIAAEMERLAAQSNTAPEGTSAG